MLDLARLRNPSAEFVEGDALALPFADGSADVVIDGAALIHIGDECGAMREYARVARAIVILQSVTCSESSANTVFAKRAYGEPVREYAYSRQLLVEAVEAVDMKVDMVMPGLDYDLQKHIGVKTVSETWVLSHAA
jgi:ubiquinone/menaquinone biosynthesis C-methylase UbiE